MSSNNTDSDNKNEGFGWGSIGVAVAVGAVGAWLFSGTSSEPQCQGYSRASESTSRPSAAYQQRQVKCETCSVCIEEIQPVVQLECGHRFHKACVDRWLQEKKVCPNCRHPVRRV